LHADVSLEFLIVSCILLADILTNDSIGIILVMLICKTLFYKGDVWMRFLQMNSVDVGGVKIMEKTILDRLKLGEIKDI